MTVLTGSIVLLQYIEFVRPVYEMGEDRFPTVPRS